MPLALPERGGRMSSCNFTMTLRKRTRPNTALRSKTNPSNNNAGAGVSCSFGKLCKGILGLRIHQSKAKCQLAENNLKSPTKKCFVSIKNLLLSSIFKFGDLLYWRTPANSFIQIVGTGLSVPSAECFVEVKDIVVDPLPEHFNENILACGNNKCLTCPAFISSQEFCSAFTSGSYKTVTYETLNCGSTNVIYGIHCQECSQLIYVGETGRSLRARMNGHRGSVRNNGQYLLHKFSSSKPLYY